MINTINKLTATRNVVSRPAPGAGWDELLCERDDRPDRREELLPELLPVLRLDPAEGGCGEV
jgi:hypothetical protein